VQNIRFTHNQQYKNPRPQRARVFKQIFKQYILA